MDETERPQRIQRALCLLSGYEDADYSQMQLQKQESFKTAQAYERIKSIVEKKEKDFQIKLSLNAKGKRRGVHAKAFETKKRACELDI